MISEQSLQKILAAANPEDAEDVAVRTFLVDAFRNGVVFREYDNDGSSGTTAWPIPSLLASTTRDRRLGR